MKKLRKIHIVLIIAAITIVMVIIRPYIVSAFKGIAANKLYEKNTPEWAIEQDRHIKSDDVLVYDIINDFYVGCIYGEDGFFHAVAGVKKDGKYISLMNTRYMRPKTSFTKGICCFYTYEYNGKMLVFALPWSTGSELEIKYDATVNVHSVEDELGNVYKEVGQEGKAGKIFYYVYEADSVEVNSNIYYYSDTGEKILALER